ncbi:MAG: DUF4411 family protein [Thaumarchaeota archaeon]|nr:DUF4411 family protein [Nitrososphaerota archaeon]
MVQSRFVGSFVWDTSALINLVNDYPSNARVFNPIWNEINGHLKDNLMIAPKEVYNEVNLQKDLCRTWCMQHQGIFRSVTIEMATFMDSKVKPVYDGKYWRDKNINNRPWPDPWVIAMAAVEDATVISDERDENRQNKIPWVCQKVNVKSMTLFDFFRQIQV